MSFKMPTQFIDLPSKGLVYPKANTLSTGSIEMIYPGAKQEDIMSNESYIDQGIMFDKLISSIIVSDIDYDDMILGDQNQIFIAARILTFGKDYTFNYLLPGENTPIQMTHDLTLFKEKDVDFSLFKNSNEFDFDLPICKAKITFKLLTRRDEKAITQEVNALKKISGQLDKPESITWYHTIIAVDGIRDTKTIRDFVDNVLITLDSDPLRKYMRKISPNVDFRFNYTRPNGEVVEDLPFYFGRDFFRSNSAV